MVMDQGCIASRNICPDFWEEENITVLWAEKFNKKQGLKTLLRLWYAIKEKIITIITLSVIKRDITTDVSEGHAHP